MSTSGSADAPAPANARPSKLLARLRRDIKEFQDQPYAGIDIRLHDEIDTLCLLLTPQSGPLRGLTLHFEVILPERWPALPPKVRSSTGIEHPNIFVGWGSSGAGDQSAYICCDLLKTKEQIYAAAGYTGGYTPALTLRSLSMQLLSFFSSRLVEQDGGGIISLGDETYTMYHRGDLNDEKLKDYALQMDYGYRYYNQSTEDETTLEKQFEEAYKTTKSQKQFKYVVWGDYGAPTSSKAGRWEGWRTGEKAPLELEIIKIVTMKPQEQLVRLRKRNQRWKNSYNKLINYSCDKCCYNKQNGISVVDETLVTPLKFTLDRIDNKVWKPETETKETKDSDDSKAATSNEVVSEGVCHLDKLHDDLLLCLTDHMSSESILSFGGAYPRFKAIVSGAHILILRELNCFFLRTPLNAISDYRNYGRTVLGVGVHLDQKTFSMSSSFDFLSAEAFDRYKVRVAIDKSPFEFFLPLWFNKEHYNRAKGRIWESLGEIQAALAPKNRSRKQMDGGHALAWQSRISVLSRFMNNVVVELMKTADEAIPDTTSSWDIRGASRSSMLLASEKSVNAYCQLFNLLRHVAETAPEFVRSANEAIQRFETSERYRDKEETPDLGELIVLFCLVNTVRNRNIATAWAGKFIGPLLEESFTRNVRWILEKEPSLANLKNGVSEEARLKLTFQNSKTSLRLVMFQCFFMRLVSSNGSRLDANYGFPLEHIAEMVVKEIKSIYAVNTWKDYFRKIGYTRGLSWTQGLFCERLRDRVRESLRRRYHDEGWVKKAIASKAKAERERAAAATSVVRRNLIGAGCGIANCPTCNGGW